MSRFIIVRPQFGQPSSSCCCCRLQLN